MTSDTTLAQNNAPRFVRNAAIISAATLLAGCATVKNPSANDPWESYNRTMYTINDNVDRALFKPVANMYQALVPNPARTCVHNMFNNLADVWSAVNSFLQARGHDFFNTLGRVLFNSTMGLGGCIDVASMNGSRRIVNDFGVTLGVWGLKPGPYVVLPLLGASTVRDTAGTAVSFASGLSPTTAVMSIDDVRVRNGIIGLYFIDQRASLLEADKLVNDIALDRYSFIRDAYLQRRKSLVDSRLNHPSGSGYQEDLPNYEDNEDLPDYSDDAGAPKGTPGKGAQAPATGNAPAPSTAVKR